jgi:hypothetical protein
MSNDPLSSSTVEIELDPYSCLSHKGKKYAKETEEVYLANLGGTSLSESFRDFFNLEVVWFNNNRLTRLDNLEPCFRIREMYLQNNRLVSLKFLKSFKFLRTLLLSNNQIKNLDKQIQLLTRLSSLKKLDLFDNSIADEPDYRLRMIYHVPQVELLDRLGVTFEQRQRAEEVVPNMDKVAAAPPVRAPKKAFTFTVMEKDCFRQSKAIRNERQRVEEDALRTQVFSKGMSSDAWSADLIPRCRNLRSNTEHWSSPSHIVKREMHTPAPWEKQWTTSEKGHAPCKSLQAQVEELAGKEELNKQDVQNLTRQLCNEGIEDFGRALSRPNVFGPLRDSLGESMRSRSKQLIEASSGKSEPHSLAPLMDNAEATMPTKEVVKFLLTLPWHRLSDQQLDERISKHNDQARLACLRATFGVQEVKYGQAGDDQVFFKCRDKVARLEGLKTRKSEVNLLAKPEAPVLRKSRSDFFSQSFIKPKRCIDEATGRTMVSVAQGSKHTRICG